jgi:hypothetical protein
MAATTALREALNQGISSGNLIDTKIIVYSHRDSSGVIRRPKALYANSHVLKKVPYFKDCERTSTFDAIEESHVAVSEVLFGNFSESQSKDFKEAVNEEESADDYGYLSDSDLEEDEDEKPSFKHTNKPKINSFDPFPAPSEDKIVCE